MHGCTDTSPRCGHGPWQRGAGPLAPCVTPGGLARASTMASGGRTTRTAACTWPYGLGLPPRRRSDTMIMRITRGQLHPGTWRVFEQAYKDTVVAKGAEVDGLRGRWLVQDDDKPETAYAVSLWDSHEAMWAYEQSAFYIYE